MHNVDREMKTLRKNQKEILEKKILSVKSVTKMKNAFAGLTYRHRQGRNQ